MINESFFLPVYAGRSIFPAVKEVNNEGKQDAYQDAAGQGQVELEIFTFDGNIARQFSEVGNAGHIRNDQPGKDENYSDNYQQLAHGVKIFRNLHKVFLLLAA